MNSLQTKLITAANATLISEGKLEQIDEFFTVDYKVHFSAVDTAAGHGMIRKAVKLLKDAFPNVKLKIDILVESDNRVTWMRTLSGIQDGKYKGFPANKSKIVWRDMVTSEFRDGKIAQEWVVTDLAERLLLSRKS